MCEIDPHARSVLDRRWPDVPKHDDVTTLTADTFGPADVITGGFPCQDLSVAGKRAGLDGERSGLFFEIVRIVHEMREATDGQYPRWVVLENVVGAFSSNGGEDFAAVLASLVGGEVRRPADGWAYAGVAFGPLGSAEWRVLDSQHFGVAQRRRRVFLVYHPGGERAGQVLLEPQGVPGHPPKGRAPGEGATGSAAVGIGAYGLSGELDADHELIGTLLKGSPTGGGNPPMVASTLTTREGKGPDSSVTTTLIPVAFKVRGGKEGGGKGYLGSEDKALTISTVQEQYLAEPRPPAIGFDHAAGAQHGLSEREEISPTLQASSGIGRAAAAIPIQDGRGMAKAQNGLGVGDPSAPSYTVDTTGAQAVAFALRGRTDGAMPEVSGDRTNALRGSEGGSSRDYVATIQNTVIGRNDNAGPGGAGYTEGPAFTLDTKEPHAVAFAENSRNEIRLEGGNGTRTGTLSTGGGKPGQGTPTIATPYAVRRLTPVECERLQGFPDGHTQHAADGSEIADTHRYRMMGNAVSVPVAEWIAKRLAQALTRPENPLDGPRFSEGQR